MEHYNKELENNLLEMIKQKEQADKRLLNLEVFIGVTVSVILFTTILLSAFAQIPDWVRILLIVLGIVPFAIGIAYALRIEQTAGYYKCAKCGHRYVPTYKSVLMAAHINRTRYMCCPQCHQKSWQKKVLTKE